MRIRGQKAELQAQIYLEKQGLKLLTKNYNVKVGEIDLIMQDQKTLVFVEVRLRCNSHYGTGLDSVTPAKQRKIIKAAQCYLQTHQLCHHTYCRFDVISLNQQAQIVWIKDAFAVQ